MNNCRLHELNEDSLNALFTAFKNSTSLQDINLRRYAFNNETALKLADVIENNSNLKSIDLSNCHLYSLDEESLNALFTAFKNNSSITHINFSGITCENKADANVNNNNIIALKLADLIENNQNIISINLTNFSFYGCNKNSLNKLLKAFKNNTTIKNIIIEKDHWWAKDLNKIVARNREIYMNNYINVSGAIRNYEPTFIPNKVKLNNLPREIHEHILDYTLGKEHSEELLETLVKKSFRANTVEEKKKKDCSITSYCTIV